MGAYKLRANLKLNAKFHLEQEMLRDGLFTNVGSGTLFYDGSDQSVLLADTNATSLFVNMQPGQIWQSAFRNWVYESGVVLNRSINLLNRPTPTLCSGVYVNNVFKPTQPWHPAFDPAFKHTIDYINGRIIFDNAISLDSKVQAEFSYKHVRIDYEHVLNRQRKFSFLESKFTTNPLTSNQLVYPSGFAYPFPAVFIEIDERSSEGWELGNRSLKMYDHVKCHIWALDDLTRDNIVDIISYQKMKTLNGIDFNIAPLPLSGIFNTLSPEYIPYQVLLTNPEVSGIGFPNYIRVIQFKSYINEMSPKNDEPYEEFVKSTVNGVFETILIMPNQPIGLNLGTFGFTEGTV